MWLDAWLVGGYVALGLYEFGAAVAYPVDTDATVWNGTGVREVPALLKSWVTMSGSCPYSRVSVDYIQSRRQKADAANTLSVHYI